MQALTLQQALASNKQNNNRQDRRTVKSWYERGYYLKDDGLWYSMHGGREFVKYSTA